MQPTRPASTSGSASNEGQPGMPPSNRYFQLGGRSAFAHHLPPPIPSNPSPQNGHFYPSSPGYRDISSLGHTDPASWSSERPTSNRSSSRWSPTLPALALSPRNPELESGHGSAHQLGGQSGSQHRLPPLNDYPQRPASGWGDPPSTGHSSITSRPPTSYESYRPSSSSHQRQPQPSNLHPSQSYPSYQPQPQLHERIRRPSDVQPYTPAAGSPDQSSVRGAPESPQEAGSKKKKRRVALSCAECAKRKQKCNRETPCQHCVSRRVPELCVPYTRNTSPSGKAGEKKEGGKDVKAERDGGSVQGGTPAQAHMEEPGMSQPQVSAQAAAQPAAPAVGGARAPSVLPTLSVRVMRLEAMVNTMINQVPNLEGKALQDWRINHAPLTPPHTNNPPLRQRAISIASSRGPGPIDTARGSRDASVGQEAGLMTGIDVESSTRNPLPQSMLDTADPVPLGLNFHSSAAEPLQSVLTDCGVSPHKIQDLMSQLPPRADADDLVEWFFTKINYIRYPISEHLFRQSYTALYDNRSINGAAVLALPLVFIVLAMAVRVAPDEWVGGEEAKRATSLRMYWNSRMAINIASAVKAETVQLVEARICTGLYLVLMHDRRLAEGWAEFRAGITTGQAVGLHRDGSKLGLDGYSSEYRRRLWAYLVHADATYSCLLGRPISIDLRTCDTLPPSNLNMCDYQTSASQPVPRPLSQPTFATYLILRRQLGEIVANVTHHFQRLDGGGGYKDVEVLDGEFRRLREGLPETFRMDRPNRSWDDQCWYLPVHRYYIQTEILHFIIILHRPWLLKRLRSNRYQLSRQACFEAAVTDYKIRQAWKKDCPDFFETLLGSSFREFNAAMIAGISMIVDPRGPHAADMRHIVQDFMHEHPHNPRADDFSQKEAAIIYTLHRRALEMEERRSQRHSLVRSNLSNERGQPMSSPSRGDGRMHQSPRSKDEAEMPAPSIPHRASFAMSTGSYGPDGDQTPGKTPLMQFINGHMGLTPASTSSDEEGPQKLLDQWLMANTTYGPGADATINPYISTYTGLPPMYQYNTPSTSNSNLQHQSLGTGPYDPQLGNASGSGLYTDPLTGGPGGDAGAGGSSNFGLGLDPRLVPLEGGEGGLQRGERMPSLVGPPGEDGNPMVFWDRLIDGIVVGQGYDLTGVPSL